MSTISQAKKLIEHIISYYRFIIKLTEGLLLDQWTLGKGTVKSEGSFYKLEENASLEYGAHEVKHTGRRPGIRRHNQANELTASSTENNLLSRIQKLTEETENSYSGDAERACQLKNGDSVVIVGGGYAGSIIAINFKKLNPDIEVKLIERRSEQACCHAGGRKTCKGCFGWIAATAVDKLADLGINVPPELVIGAVDKVEFKNISEPGSDGIFTDPPKPVIRRGLVISNGNGPAGLMRDKDISFTNFLRGEAEKLGVEIIPGLVRDIFVPQNPQNKAFVAYEDVDGTVPNKIILTADMVVNASGVNDPNIIATTRFERVNSQIKTERVDQPVKQHAAGVFEVMLKDQEIEKLRLSRKSFMYWYGMKGTEAILTIIKSINDTRMQGIEPQESQEFRKNWMTIVISPAENVLETIKDKALIRKKLTEMYYEFLARSGMSEVIGERVPQCRCLPNVPVEVSDYRTDNRYALVGDVIGNMKYKKNGIGVLIDYAERLAETAVCRGVSREALEKGTRKKALKTKYDNMVGSLVFKGAVLINQHPILVDLEKRLLSSSHAIRQLGSRIVIGNTEFETTYTGNILTTIKDLLRIKRLPIAGRVRSAMIH